MAEVEVKLKRVANCNFEAQNADGSVAMIDGPPSLGGE